MKNGIFISYCHEENSNTQRIHEIAEKLEICGLSVVIDRYDLHIGNDIDHFMDALANKRFRAILVMCTSEYKRKADGNIGGVGRETQQYKHYLSDPDQEHVIPVIIEEGEISGMIPSVFPKNPLCIDLSASTDFEQSFQQLVSILQGVRPVRPPFSELHSLLQCSRADFSG